MSSVLHRLMSKDPSSTLHLHGSQQKALQLPERVKFAVCAVGRTQECHEDSKQAPEGPCRHR